jgi:hypothetical protein
MRREPKASPVPAKQHQESWQSARARLAIYTRHHGPNDPLVPDLQRDLRAARAEEYLAKVIAQAPPLTPEQAERLRQLLPPVPRNESDDIDGFGDSAA